MTRSIFASWLALDPLGSVDRARGRSRWCLLACCNHFLANRPAREQASRRGGGRARLSIDFRDAEGRYAHELSHELKADRIFERRWALTSLDRVHGRFLAEMDGAAKGERSRRLLPALLGSGESVPHARVAEGFGLTAGPVEVASHRLRRRHREQLVEEVERTLKDPSTVDEAIRDWFVTLSC